MKKISFLMSILFLLTACSNPTTEKPPVVKWVDKIITEYPNYHSNKLVKQVVRDSVSNYANRFIGYDATILDGVEFRFVRMIENRDSVAVFFDAKSCYSDIDYKEAYKEHIFTDIIIRVLGKIDRQTASKLDKDQTYTIKGKVHAWDAEDKFFISHSTLDYIDLGTFILNSNIEINKIQDE